MSCWVNLVSCNSEIHLLILFTYLSETVVEWIQYDVNTVLLLTNLAGAHMWDIPDSTCGKLRLSLTPPNEEVVVWKRILFNWLDMSHRCKVRTPRHRAALAEEEGKEGSHSIRAPFFLPVSWKYLILHLGTAISGFRVNKQPNRTELAAVCDFPGTNPDKR